MARISSKPPVVRRLVLKRELRLLYKEEPKLAESSLENAALDEIIFAVIKAFDFTPLFSGDSLKARFVALDLEEEILSRAEEKGIALDVMKRRMAEIRTLQVESLQAFTRRFTTL